LRSCAGVFGASSSRRWAAGAVLLGLFLVSFADSWINPQIRIFPLYFLPLVAAAWRFGQRGAACCAVLAAVAWAIAAYLSGGRYDHGYFWAINFSTQLIAFLSIALLVAYLRDALKRERDLSHKDALTGLSNRRSFFERAADVLALCHRHHRAVALAVVDLDNFKAVNDRHGHEAGDALLKTVAGALNETLRTSDIIARVGGDEFFILLPESDLPATETTLDKLRQHLEHLPALRSECVTASVGAVVCHHAPRDVSEMIRCADALMYRAKFGGKNRVEVARIEPDVGVVS